MNIERAIRKLLIDDSAVGAEVGKRVFPVLAITSTAGHDGDSVDGLTGLPAITYQDVATVINYTLGGQDGRIVRTVQLRVIGNTKTEVQRVAGKVLELLSGYSGDVVFVDKTYHISRIFFTDDSDDSFQPSLGRETQVNSTMLSIEVAFTTTENS